MEIDTSLFRMYPPGYRSGDEYDCCPDCTDFSWCDRCKPPPRPYDPIRDRQVTDEEVAAVFANIRRGSHLSDIDDNCPKCGLTMAVKHGKHGAFLGCVMFPKCKGSKSI